MRSLLLCSLLLLCAASLKAEDDVIIPALQQAGSHDVIFVLIQGAQIPAARYAANVQAIQKEALTTYGLNVWAAIPAATLDLPVLPSQVEACVFRVVSALQQKGAPSYAPFFIAGHSLGATGAMAYGNSYNTNVTGAVFYGASLLRKYNNAYPLSFISITGEMDGLQRPSRVAEGYYRQILHSEDKANASITSGVVSLRGVNHLQFADGENPPLAVKMLDLKAEVSNDDARDAIARTTAAFLAAHTTQDEQAVAFLQQAVLQDTAEILEPLVDVMLTQEGNPHLRKPCDSDHPAPHCPFYPAWPLQPTPRTPSSDDDCTCQVEWANTAAITMAGLPASAGYSVTAVNSIHDVTDTKPYHHAHIWNNCTGPCVLNVTTVAQQIYPSFDDWDTGFTQATANELRVKIKSRQAAYQQSAYQPNATLDVDNVSVCSQINQMAYQYALENIPAATRDRFMKYGQPIVFADDHPIFIPIGPLWIYSPLKLEEVEQNNVWVLRVTSISMKTPVDGWITKLYPDSNGYHYCKLLSPARAMEWIYTDGVRRQLGLNH